MTFNRCDAGEGRFQEEEAVLDDAVVKARGCCDRKGDRWERSVRSRQEGVVEARVCRRGSKLSPREELPWKNAVIVEGGGYRRRKLSTEEVVDGGNCRGRRVRPVRQEDITGGFTIRIGVLLGR